MKTKLFTLIFICFLGRNIKAQSWSPLGAGLNGSVYALAEYNGELYAGGVFTTAGGGPANYIAKWNGTAWTPVGTGMNSIVYALAVCNGELFAGGAFTSAGGAPANYIAKWNGSAWSPVGGGFSDHVYALTVHNGALCAAGKFYLSGNTVATWTGTVWTSFAAVISPSPVNALMSYNGVLYAGLSYNGCIAKWNGSNWVNVGSGMSGGPSGNSSVLALGVYNGSLYAGGKFTMANSSSAPRIAKWNGSTWSSLQTGVAGFSDASVNSLAVYNGKLYAGGWFTTANISQAYFVASWNDTAWSSVGVGVNGDVRALAVYNGALYAGGDLTKSGLDSVNHIAKWSANNIIAHNSKTETVNTAGGILHDNGSAIVSDNKKNMYVTGVCRDTAHFQDTSFYASSTAGGTDAFIAKYDLKGNRKWIRKIAGSPVIKGDAYGASITIDSNNNVIATGYYVAAATICDTSFWENGSSQIYIAKYDSSGNCLWTKSTRTSAARPTNIKADDLGNVYLYGRFSSGMRWAADTIIYTITGSQSTTDDIFTLKYDKDGQFQWIRQIGGIYNDGVGSMVIDRQQNIVVAGKFSGNAQFSSGVYLSSYGNQASLGYGDMYIAKYDANGNLLWAKQAGGGNFDAATAVTADTLNNYYVLGTFTDSSVFSPSYTLKKAGSHQFIAKYSEQGTFLWVKVIEKFSFTGITYGAGKYNERLYLAGSFQGIVKTPNSTYASFAGSQDGIVATYDLNGNFMTGNQIGGTYQDGCNDVSVNNFSKDICVIGNYSNTLFFPDTSITSRGNWDVFFLRYIQNDTLATGIHSGEGSQAKYISIFPNPSAGKFTVRSHYADAELEIYNLFGEKIYSRELPASRVELDLSLLPNGVYVLKIRSPNGSETQKIIIQK